MSHARFSIIPGWIVTDPRLKGRDLQVLCVLGRHTDRHGWCRRSQVKMAEEMACARSTVQASIDRLAQVGVVEKHVQESRDGRDSAHFYRVVYDRAPPSGYAFDAWDDDGETEKYSTGEGMDAQADAPPPADISAPPAGPESAGVADSGPAPINVDSLTPPDERERERARERGGAGESHDDRKQLAKRVKALEMGRNGNPWPGVLGSSTDWTLRQFAALDEAERAEAEAKRDAYLAVCKAQGIKPVALGNYLRGRKFLDVTTETARAAVRKVDRVSVRPFGPVWGGMRAFCLGKGPEAIEMPGDVRGEAENLHAALRKASEPRATAWRERKGVTLSADGRLVFPDDFERAEYRRRQMSDGYPLVKHLDTLARDARAELVDGANAALGELCEPVPVGSALMAAWREHHEKMGWMAWPEPGKMAVVYLPRGGPEGFAAFMRAAEAAMADGGRDADAA